MCLKLMVVVVEKLFLWFLLKWIEMKLLLLIVDEIMRWSLEWCYVVLFMIIHALGVVKCVLWLSCCYLISFKWKWVINGELWFLMIWGELLMLLCWVRLDELMFFVIRFGCRVFWEETWVFGWKASLSDFGK